MKKMVKVLAWITIPYVLLMGTIWYFAFGTGFISGYESLNWQNIDARVPSGFKVKSYSDKGWDVYSMSKMTLFVKIAISPAVNVSLFHRQVPKVIFQQAPGSDRNYYISKLGRQGLEAVFLQTIGDKTLYFSAVSASAMTARSILEKVAGDSYYQGKKIDFIQPDVPFRVHSTDLLYFGGSLLIVPLLAILFWVGGKTPSDEHFQGDPVKHEEKFVYFRSKIKRRRRGSWGYLVLTPTRLILFLFGKPIFELNLRNDDAEVNFDGKKMIITREKDKVVITSSDIEKWKSYLSQLS